MIENSVGMEAKGVLENRSERLLVSGNWKVT